MGRNSVFCRNCPRLRFRNHSHKRCKNGQNRRVTEDTLLVTMLKVARLYNFEVKKCMSGTEFIMGDSIIIIYDNPRIRTYETGKTYVYVGATVDGVHGYKYMKEETGEYLKGLAKKAIEDYGKNKFTKGGQA